MVVVLFFVLDQQKSIDDVFLMQHLQLPTKIVNKIYLFCINLYLNFYLILTLNFVLIGVNLLCNSGVQSSNASKSMENLTSFKTFALIPSFPLY